MFQLDFSSISARLSSPNSTFTSFQRMQLFIQSIQWCKQRPHKGRRRGDIRLKHLSRCKSSEIFAKVLVSTRFLLDWAHRILHSHHFSACNYSFNRSNGATKELARGEAEAIFVWSTCQNVKIQKYLLRCLFQLDFSSISARLSSPNSTFTSFQRMQLFIQSIQWCNQRPRKG